MKKKTKKYINLNLKSITKILFFIVIVFSIFGLTSAYRSINRIQHNIDLSYNMALISNDLNVHFNGSGILDYRQWEDLASNGKIYSYVSIYWNSIYSVDKYIYIMMLHTFLITYSLMVLVFVIK